MGPPGLSVLIPSSSGLHFKHRDADGRRARCRGLNPFFVRSSFQTRMIARFRRFGRSLNPFFVRSSFQTVGGWSVYGAGRGVLIPSSSGLHFKQCALHGWAICFVLIPSSSGLHFKRLVGSHNQAMPYRVLIPSSSGLHFKLEASGHTRYEQMRLNPFFVRSSFQTVGGHGTQRSQKSLNPFFVRSSFQTSRWVSCPGRSAVLIPSSSGLHFKPADGVVVSSNR